METVEALSWRGDRLDPRIQIPGISLRMRARAMSGAWLLVLFVVLQDILAGEGSSLDCPVRIQDTNTSYCQCNVISEIYCYKLDSIPEFIPDGVKYSGIYLDHQDIRAILQGVFVGIQVKKIVLNYNPIGDKISVNALDGLQGVLEELHMASCKIRSPPEGMLAGFGRLRILHLWNNQIETIPSRFFSRARNITELVLWGNKLRSLSKETFAGLWNLRKLDLDKNEIEALDKHTFRHLTKLESLQLGENKINHIYDDTFSFMGKLKVLNLDRNGLGYVYDNAFKGLRSLLTLSLNNNALVFLPDALFDDLPYLSILLLQHNNLEFIWSRHLEQLRRLQHLDLSYNKFVELPDRVFWKAPSLTQLLLDHNMLKTLRVCSLLGTDTNNKAKAKGKLKILSLVGNPLECDCRLDWLVAFAERGVTVLGTCAHTKANTAAGVSDRCNYEAAECQYKKQSCKD